MFTLWQHNEAYTVGASDGSAVRVDRASGAITSSKQPPSAGKPIAAVLGVIQLRVSKYLIIAETGTRAGDLLEHTVYRLADFQLLPLRVRKTSTEVEAQFLALVKSHLASAPLFYSPTYDLTTALQRYQPASFPYEHADDRFWWNKAVAAPFVEAAQTDGQIRQFVAVCIYGVYSIDNTAINGTPAKFGLITRRSRYRAGTRYFRRGIDIHGHTANYNETEQLLILGPQTYFSYVQTRGSVPAFWGEINHMQYRPRLTVGESSIEAAAKHFAEQEKLYGPQYLVNLVNQSGYEKAIKDTYETVVQNLNDKNLTYVYFDFHHECSKMRWHNVYLLVDQLRELGLDRQGWFEVVDGKPVSKQTSVVRTNCMDCLDRTNVVQSCLGGWTLQRQLEHVGILKQGQKWEDDTHFLQLFRNVWADNADGVSCAYSGTGALKTDFTRTGQRTRVGALKDLRNSIARFYLNNLRDGPRQDAYNLFLGDYSPFEHVESPFLDRRPLLIQSVPYILGGSAFVFLLSVLYPSPKHSATFDFGVSLFFLTVIVGTWQYIVRNGLQYVNWPRLLPLDYVQWQDGNYGWGVIEKLSHVNTKQE